MLEMASCDPWKGQSHPFIPSSKSSGMHPFHRESPSSPSNFTSCLPSHAAAPSSSKSASLPCESSMTSVLQGRLDATSTASSSSSSTPIIRHDASPSSSPSIARSSRRVTPARCWSVAAITIILMLMVTSCCGLQIPDQQAYVGKVFYYRLPLNRTEAESIKEIKVTETTSGSSPSLPRWLAMMTMSVDGQESLDNDLFVKRPERTVSFIELVGIPSYEDKKMHFFHVKLVKTDGSRTDDVFVLDVIDLPSSSFPSSSSLSSSGSNHERDCILRIIPKFGAVHQLWKLIRNLMPPKLHHLMNGHRNSLFPLPSDDESPASGRFDQLDQDLTGNPSNIVQQWLTPLFTVNGYMDEEGFRYQLTVDQQQCDVTQPNQVSSYSGHRSSSAGSSSTSSSNSGDFRSGLQRLGMEFHTIRILRPSSSIDDEDSGPSYYNTRSDGEEEEGEGSEGDSNEDNQGLKPSHVGQDVIDVSPNLRGHGKRRAGRWRRAGHIYSTPVEYPDPPAATISGVGENGGSFEPFSLQPGDTLTRIIPSLTSPSFSFGSTTILGSVDSNNKGHLGHLEEKAAPKRWHNIYSTPVYQHVPPTQVVDAWDNPNVNEVEPNPHVLTPTHTVLFSSFSTNMVEMPFNTPVFESSMSSIPVEPTPALPRNAIVVPITESFTTTTTTETSSSTTEQTEQSTTPEAEVAPTTEDPFDKVSPTHPSSFTPLNTAPKVNRRMRKLLVTSGIWYKHLVPEDTFYDDEQGGTRNLSLGLYSSGEVSITSSSWIQFDLENQFIYALPTDVNVGNHQYILMAVDAAGSIAKETIHIKVSQHKSTRSFNHEFRLYEVNWDTNQYPVVIEAVWKMLTLISSQVIGDQNQKSINVRTISPDAPYTIGWTNESMSVYPCPSREISDIYDMLSGNKKPIGPGVQPSSRLKQSLGKDFVVRAVGLNLVNACAHQDPDQDPDSTIEVRNELHLPPLEVGQVFRMKIPEDTFYSSRVDSKDLSLQVFSVNGSPLDNQGFIGFNAQTNEIVALPLQPSKRQVDDRPQEELMLVCTDRESGKYAHDMFTVEYSWVEKARNGFEVTMTFVPKEEVEEFNLDVKLNLITRLATSLFGDVDTSSLKVISLTKLNYVPQGQGMHFDHLEFPSNTFYYELVWTNRSISSPGNRGKEWANTCPENAIRETIVKPLFDRGSSSLERVQGHFNDYRVLHMNFRPVGECSKILSAERVGEEPVAVISIPASSTTTHRPNGRNPVLSTPSLSEEESEREYYMTSIFPALITLGIMLFVALIMVCVLVKYRKGQDKSRFEVIAHSRSGDYSTERDAFLVKGRAPVIFQQELQQQHLLSQQQPNQTPFGFYSPIIPPQGQHLGQQPTPPVSHHPMHQMTPMRNAAPLPSQSPYQSHHTQGSQQQMGQQQRRQPPPYYK